MQEGRYSMPLCSRVVRALHRYCAGTGAGTDEWADHSSSLLSVSQVYLSGCWLLYFGVL